MGRSFVGRVFMLVAVMLVCAAVVGVGNVYAATMRTLQLDCNKFNSDQSSEAEGWSWKQSTRTLTLENAKISAAASDMGSEIVYLEAILLPENSTIYIPQGTETSIEGAVGSFGKLTILNDGTLHIAGDIDRYIAVAVYGSPDDGSLTISGGKTTLKADVGISCTSGPKGALLIKDTELEIIYRQCGIMTDNIDISIKNSNVTAEFVEGYVFNVGIGTKGSITIDSNLTIEEGGSVKTFGSYSAISDTNIGYDSANSKFTNVSKNIKITGAKFAPPPAPPAEALNPANVKTITASGAALHEMYINGLKYGDIIEVWNSETGREKDNLIVKASCTTRTPNAGDTGKVLVQIKSGKMPSDNKVWVTVSNKEIKAKEGFTPARDATSRSAALLITFSRLFTMNDIVVELIDGIGAKSDSVIVKNVNPGMVVMVYYYSTANPDATKPRDLVRGALVKQGRTHVVIDGVDLNDGKVWIALRDTKKRLYSETPRSEFSMPAQPDPPIVP